MSDATKIDRDALAEVLFYAARRDDWGAANDDEREEFYDQADAVIAHLSTLPVEGEVEWEYGVSTYDTSYEVWSDVIGTSREFGERFTDSGTRAGTRMHQRRKAGPWEVVSGE